MGVHLKWMEIQLCVLLSFIIEHFSLCRVVDIHHLLDCQQKRLQKMPLHWTARVHFVHIDEPLTPAGKRCPLGSGQKIISCEVSL